MSGGICDAIRGCCCRRRRSDDDDDADEKREPLLEGEGDEKRKGVAFAEGGKEKGSDDKGGDAEERSETSSTLPDERSKSSISSSDHGSAVEKGKNSDEPDKPRPSLRKREIPARQVTFDEQQLDSLGRARRNPSDSADGGGGVFGERGHSEWLNSITVVDDPEDLSEDVLTSLRNMPCDDRDSLLASLMRKEEEGGDRDLSGAIIESLGKMSCGDRDSLLASLARKEEEGDRDLSEAIIESLGEMSCGDKDSLLASLTKKKEEGGDSGEEK